MHRTHTFQLNVNNTLKANSFTTILDHIRGTVKFYRKSSYDASELRVEQIQRGMKVIRPLLDVKVRWGSTLYMMQRYVKINEIMDLVTMRLYRSEL